MLFVLERRRSRWTKGAIRAERAQRAKQSNRIAPRSAEEEGGDMLFVLERRRSRWTKGAIRAERAQRAKQSKL